MRPKQRILFGGPASQIDEKPGQISLADLLVREVRHRITRITGRQQLILEVVSYFQKQYNTEIFEGLGCRKDDMDFPKGDIKNITDVSTWQECGKQQGIRMDGLICLLFEVSKVL